MFPTEESLVQVIDRYPHSLMFAATAEHAFEDNNLANKSERMILRTLMFCDTIYVPPTRYTGSTIETVTCIIGSFFLHFLGASSEVQDLRLPHPEVTKAKGKQKFVVRTEDARVIGIERVKTVTLWSPNIALSRCVLMFAFRVAGSTVVCFQPLQFYVLALCLWLGGYGGARPTKDMTCSSMTYWFCFHTTLR